MLQCHIINVIRFKYWISPFSNVCCCQWHMVANGSKSWYHGTWHVSWHIEAWHPLIEQVWYLNGDFSIVCEGFCQQNLQRKSNHGVHCGNKMQLSQKPLRYSSCHMPWIPQLRQCHIWTATLWLWPPKCHAMAVLLTTLVHYVLYLYCAN